MAEQFKPYRGCIYLERRHDRGSKRKYEATTQRYVAEIYPLNYRVRKRSTDITELKDWLKDTCKKLNDIRAASTKAQFLRYLAANYPLKRKRKTKEKVAKV